jgi:hypothetical protein
MTQYDGVRNAVSPTLDYVATMDDYTGTISGTWPQRAWVDPNDFIWYYNSNTFTQPGGFTGGAVMVGGGQTVTGFPTHFYTGAIISRNPPGYDKHFWFGFERKTASPVCSGAVFIGTQWLHTYNGGYSDSDGRATLPASTLRWQDLFEAQSDPLLVSGTPSFGNLPQSWMRIIGSVGHLQKFIVGKVPWRSVNFGRPYGADKWAVVNTTVCVTDGTHIRRTGNAIDPLAAGGLANGDTVMVGGSGIYTISSIVAAGTSSDWSGRNQFTFALSAKIADIPAGVDIGAGYMGKMRWWTAPPFGLTRCTAVYDGVNTTFTLAATPYWVSESGAAITKNVDLYAAASNTNPASSVLANVTLTKSAVGATTITIAGDYSTAKFIIPHLHYAGVQFKPEYDDDTAKGDSLRVEWQFNRRGGYSASPPTWYFGHTGILSAGVTSVRTRFSPCCPSVIGHVPYYLDDVGDDIMGVPTSFKVEDFTNADLGIIQPYIPADDVYGGFAMYEVIQKMDDVFWTAPFQPDLASNVPWVEDDGSGTGNFAHRPYVEAISVKPSNLGWSGTDTPPDLPTGCVLPYDGSTAILPEWWPYGIEADVHASCSAVGGGFKSLTTDYGFYNLACETIRTSGTFASNYTQWIYK